MPARRPPESLASWSSHTAPLPLATNYYMHEHIILLLSNQRKITNFHKTSLDLQTLSGAAAPRTKSICSINTGNDI